jgi:hypothetical protein
VDENKKMFNVLSSVTLDSICDRSSSMISNLQLHTGSMGFLSVPSSTSHQCTLCDEIATMKANSLFREASQTFYKLASSPTCSLDWLLCHKLRISASTEAKLSI